MGKLLSRAIVVHAQALSRAGVVGILEQELGIVEVAQLDSVSHLTHHLESHSDWLMLVIDPAIEGFGGIDGIAKVRRTFPSLRVVVLAESSDRKAVLAALAAGAHGFVASNAALEEMVLTFRTVLEGHIHVPDEMADLDEEKALDNHFLSASELTVRQQDVARQMALGLSNKEIGRVLGISESTVKVHMSAVFKALGVSNRVQAVGAIEGLSLLRRTTDDGLILTTLEGPQGKLFH
jgi:DNA-binding NarL/FixJ family response regulator